MFLKEMDKSKPVHMIGIGGISMSGIAEILLSMGYTVTGSDSHLSEITERLEKNNIKVYNGHYAENVIGAGIVVYTAAIKPDNPELSKARELNIPTIERSEFLGELTKLYSETIAISGTHGKSTTTSMISLIFMEALKDPTIQVGADLKQLNGTNYRIGSSPYFIVEACEYVESFLKFSPKTAIILNIEEDHLDYYRDINHIKSAFLKFAELVPADGTIIINADNKNCNEIIEKMKSKVVTFGIENEKADWTAKNIHLNANGHYSFTASSESLSIDITLSVFGMHNVYNALAAVATASLYNIEPFIIQKALADFTGAHRRFEYTGSFNNAQVYDDYAHHPTEIKATIDAAKNLPHNKLWVIFQPHTYSRTSTLFDEFANAFKAADEVILADIYAAREIDTGIVSSQKLALAINEVSNNCTYLGDFSKIEEYLKENVAENDLVLTVGAGDVYKIGKDLIL